MEFAPHIFRGMPIGRKYVDGTDVCCGDKVVVTQEVTEYNYERPILNHDNQTFSYLQSKHTVRIEGRIAYSPSFCAFAFMPFDVQNSYVPYVQKMISDYTFKAIEKVQEIKALDQ